MEDGTPLIPSEPNPKDDEENGTPLIPSEPNPKVDDEKVDASLTEKPPDAEEEDSLTKRLRKKPQMTEVGKANLIKTLKNQITSILRRLNRQLGVITPLLESKDFAKVTSETSILDRIFSDLMETHARFCEVLDSDEDGEEFLAAQVKMDEAECQYFECKTNLYTWQLQ